MKKIIISTYDDIKNPHYGGGGAIAVHEIAKRLSKEFDVRVISWDYNGKKRETLDGVVYERFGFPFLSPKVAMFCYQITLPFIALRKQYDVWLESFCPPFTTAMLPLFTKKSVVGVVHMLAAEDMERKYNLPFHLIQNVGLRQYASLITMSEGLKEKIARVHPKGAITVISNGVAKVFTPQKKKEKNIVFIGRIEVDQKGIDLLLTAFETFSKIHKEYKLVIAGNGDAAEKDHLKRLIKKHKVEKSVVVKGKVIGEEKESLLRTASCVVITSRFETYSLAALEALAYGAPLVCFAIDGLSWIPQNAALKVKPFVTDDFAKALTIVVSDKTAAEKLKEAGNRYAKNFTWDHIATAYKQYLSKSI